MIARGMRARTRRRGITLTEILIAIMILGVGLVSLATLFPIGLLRLRDATRSTRTKYLVDSAASDSGARSLLNPLSFGFGSQFSLPDAINLQYGLPTWWCDATSGVPVPWDPLTFDVAFYGDVPSSGLGVNSTISGGYGLPFAYDPLWRYQTPKGTGSVPNDQSMNGYYLGDQFEARFGSGIGFIGPDPSDGGLPSAHGLQRLTNFNRPFVFIGGVYTPIMPISNVVPSVFVSLEDVVWAEALASNAVSPVLPDLNLLPAGQQGVFPWYHSRQTTGIIHGCSPDTR